MIKTFILLILWTTTGHAFNKKNNVSSCQEKAKGPCYEFSGRARVHTNNAIRIWKIGTKRIYRVAWQSESAFKDLKHLTMATEMFATFDMCFLQPETPSGISDICIQSVKKPKTTATDE